jgi:hypothetical protein
MIKRLSHLNLDKFGQSMLPLSLGMPLASQRRISIALRLKGWGGFGYKKLTEWGSLQIRIEFTAEKITGIGEHTYCIWLKLKIYDFRFASSGILFSTAFRHRNGTYCKFQKTNFPQKNFLFFFYPYGTVIG